MQRMLCMMSLKRNKAHALPYFLGGIENLNYVKNRIRIWFVTDHNDDETLEILKTWSKAWEVCCSRRLKSSSISFLKIFFQFSVRFFPRGNRQGIRE